MCRMGMERDTHDEITNDAGVDIQFNECHVATYSLEVRIYVLEQSDLADRWSWLSRRCLGNITRRTKSSMT